MTALRFCAILIAILGVVDPALTSARTAPVTIALLDTTSAMSAPGSVNRIAAALSARHTVVRGPTADATMTIVAGDALPPRAGSIAGPALAVVPPPAADGVAIARVVAPTTASFESRVPVRVELRPMKDRTARVVVALHVSGAVVDRVEQDVAAGAPAVVNLSFVPIARGAVTARVSAALAGAAPRAFADLAVDVTNRPWSVLVFDRRPSWMSTFVRRALEADARFKVTSRTATSTTVTAASSGAPASLGTDARLDRFDAIVVGAPDALTAADAAGLAGFARRQGGAVIALMDRNDPGPLGALGGVPQWTGAETASPVDVATPRAMTPAMRASEFAVPASVPETGGVAATFASGATSRPVVIDVPLGAGRVIFSGMLDAWRYRGAPGASAFDTFWIDVIGRAADATPRPLAASLDAVVVGPGESARLDVTMRDAALAPIGAAGVDARVTAHLRATSGEGDATTLRLWPAGVGRFTATVRAPSRAGTYRIVVNDGTHTADVPLVVAADARHATPDDRALLQAWAASRGGTTLDAPESPGLLAAIDRLAQPARRSERWHPMRSAWWIVPFSLLLGAEWWQRRRKDLP